jgi:heptosyltransferase I
VDRFVVYSRVLGSGAWRPLAETVQELNSVGVSEPGGRFDLLLCLQVYFKAGLLTALAPARVKLGFDRSRSRDLNWLFTTHRLPPHPDGEAHTQDQYFEFLAPLRVVPEPVTYGLTLTREEREDQQRFFSHIEGQACAVVVGTSDPRKDWTPDGYARVLEGLESDFGLTPILIGGDTERERSMARRIVESTRAKPVNALQDGIRRVLWLLDGSALVVSPDTGPLHMARAMEKPVVGLFGYTNPKRSGPYRMFSDLVVDGYGKYPGEEYPLRRRRRPGGMGRISPEMVLEKVGVAAERYLPPVR